MRWILQLEDERQLRGGGGDLIDAASAIPRGARPPAIGAWRSAASNCRKRIPALTTMPAVRRRSRSAADGGVRDGTDRRCRRGAGADDRAGRSRSADSGPRRRSARLDRAQGRGAADRRDGRGARQRQRAEWHRTPTTWAIRRRRRRGRAARRVCAGASRVVRRPGERVPRRRRPAAQPLVADRLRVSARQRSARGAGAARSVQR